MIEWISRPIRVTVAANSYTGTHNISGPVRSIVIVPPTTGSFDVLLTGPYGEVIIAESALDGQHKLKIDDTLQGDHQLQILNAPNGAWTVLITWSKF